MTVFSLVVFSWCNGRAMPGAIHWNHLKYIGTEIRKKKLLMSSSSFFYCFASEEWYSAEKKKWAVAETQTKNDFLVMAQLARWSLLTPKIRVWTSPPAKVSRWEPIWQLLYNDQKVWKGARNGPLFKKIELVPLSPYSSNWLLWPESLTSGFPLQVM